MLASPDRLARRWTDLGEIRVCWLAPLEQCMRCGFTPTSPADTGSRPGIGSNLVVITVQTTQSLPVFFATPCGGDEPPLDSQAPGCCLPQQQLPHAAPPGRTRDGVGRWTQLRRGELLFEAGVINDFNEERILRITEACKGRGLADMFLDYGVDFICRVRKAVCETWSHEIYQTGIGLCK